MEEVFTNAELNTSSDNFSFTANSRRDSFSTSDELSSIGSESVVQPQDCLLHLLNLKSRELRGESRLYHNLGFYCLEREVPSTKNYQGASPFKRSSSGDIFGTKCGSIYGKALSQIFSKDEDDQSILVEWWKATKVNNAPLSRIHTASYRETQPPGIQFKNTHEDI